MTHTMRLNGTRVHVEYDIDLHGTRSIVHVTLPGDALDITVKLTDHERLKIQRSLDRASR